MAWTIGKFATLKLVDGELAYYEDEHTQTRVFIRCLDDNTFQIALAAQKEPPADLAFTTGHGDGKASDLQTYLDMIRAKTEGDSIKWAGLGQFSKLDDVWQDPRTVGLPGMLSQGVALFSSKTPL